MTAADLFALYTREAGRPAGEFDALEPAHRAAHALLGAGTVPGPLELVDRQHGETWWVRAGACSPVGCGIAADLAEIAEAEYARGEFLTGEQARARVGLPPLPADGLAPAADGCSADARLRPRVPGMSPAPPVGRAGTRPACAEDARGRPDVGQLRTAARHETRAELGSRSVGLSIP